MVTKEISKQQFVADVSAHMRPPKIVSDLVDPSPYWFGVINDGVFVYYVEGEYRVVSHGFEGRGDSMWEAMEEITTAIQRGYDRAKAADTAMFATIPE